MGAVEGWDRGLQDLAAGAFEFVPDSLPKARSLVNAGKLRSLTATGLKRSALCPNVPTPKQALGSAMGHRVQSRHRGAQGPAKSLQTRLEASVRKAYDSKGIQGLHGATRLWNGVRNGEEIARFMA